MLRNTIKSRVRFYAVFLVMFPVLVTFTVSLLLVRGYVQRDAVHDLQQNLYYQQSFVDSWLRSVKRDVRMLANAEQVQRADAENALALFYGYLESNPDVTDVVFVNKEGVTAIDSSSSPGLHVADRAYFTEGQKGNSWISDVLVGRTSGKPIITISHPVEDPQGEFAGVLFFSVRLHTIKSFLARIGSTKGGDAYIVDSNSTMLITSHSARTAASDESDHVASLIQGRVFSPAITAAFDDELYTNSYENIFGQRVLGAAVPLQEKSWLLVNEVPMSSLLDRFYGPVGLAVGGALLSLLLASPLLQRFIKGVEEPIEDLVTVSRTLAEGAYDTSCPPELSGEAPQEIASLYDAFCEMERKVRKTIVQLEEAVVTDQLTGIANRRFLMEEGARLAGVCERAAEPCCCFMVDIDHFKRINDVHGHIAGDGVLVQFAAILLESIRSSDLLARYGGEEFTIIAPNADIHQSMVLAERIRKAIEETTFYSEGEALRCSVSIGVAEIMHRGAGGRAGHDAVPGGPEHTGGYAITPFEDALARADAALYEAKRQGRNMVVQWEELVHDNTMHENAC